MVFLARHPDRWFTTSQLAAELGLEKGAKGLAGMLGAFGRRAKHRYAGATPWESHWDSVLEESRHRMTSTVADYVLLAKQEVSE